MEMSHLARVSTEHGKSARVCLANSRNGGSAARRRTSEIGDFTTFLPFCLSVPAAPPVSRADPGPGGGELAIRPIHYD